MAIQQPCPNCWDRELLHNAVVASEEAPCKCSGPCALGSTSWLGHTVPGERVMGLWSRVGGANFIVMLTDGTLAGGQVRSEGEPMGTAEARQRFVELEQQGTTTAGSIPLPKDPALVLTVISQCLA